MNAPTKTKRSWLSTDPVQVYEGLFKSVRNPVPTDDRLFEFLARYNGVTMPVAADFLGRNEDGLRRRVRELRSQPYIWLQWADFQTKDKQAILDNHFEEKVLQLSLLARQRLFDNGIRINDDEFSGGGWHAVMSRNVRLDYEYGLKNTTDVEIIPYDNVPKTNAHSHIFSETYRAEKHDILFDLFPFLIQRQHAGKTKKRFMLGHEIDRKSEQLKETQNYANSFKQTIRRKYALLIQVFDSKAIKEQFGIPFGYVTYVASSRGRLQGLMAEWEQATTNGKEHLREYVLFKIYPDSRDNPRLTGEMLTTPFLRVQYPPLSLIN